jgi:ABC-type sugar transport system ATPase subunit
MAEVRVDGVSKFFGPFVAVDNVSTIFAEGTVTVLLGPSGCGKTTLMRMIVGLETPTAGSVTIDNQDVTRVPVKKRDIGMVFQYPVIYRGTTVARNLELPLIAAKVAPQERSKRVSDIAEVVGLTKLLDTNVDRLDNAGRQKVAVAREVARQPRVLLFDEPITNVDLTSKLELKRALKSLFQEFKQTIIYVTHDQTEAMSLADNIALMNEGQIIQMASPREIYNYPEDVFAGWFLGSPGMNFLTSGFSVSDSALSSLFFRDKLNVNAHAQRAVTMGIRPEHVRVSAAQEPGFVQAEVSDLAITIGGRFLLTISVDGVPLKAVAPHELGKEITDSVWINLPASRLHFFDSSEKLLDVGLQQ